MRADGDVLTDAKPDIEVQREREMAPVSSKLITVGPPPTATVRDLLRELDARSATARSRYRLASSPELKPTPARPAMKVGDE